MKVVFSLFALAMIIFFPVQVHSALPPYLVAFHLNDGHSIGVDFIQIIIHGDYAEEPPIPQRADFIFVGWAENPDELPVEFFDFDNTAIERLYLLYAVWLPISDTLHTVSFNMNGAPGTAPPPQIIQHGGFAKEPPIPEFPGFVFVGWANDPDEPPVDFFDFDKTAIERSHTLVAVWRNPRGTIVIGGAGSVWDSEKGGNDDYYYIDAEYGKTIELKAVPEPGWEFIGWTYFLNGAPFFNSDILYSIYVPPHDWFIRAHFVSVADPVIDPVILVIDISDNMFGLPFMAMQNIARRIIIENTVAGIVAFCGDEASILYQGIGGYPANVVANLPVPRQPSESGAPIDDGLALAGDLIKNLIADVPGITAPGGSMNHSNIRVVLLSRGLAIPGWGIHDGADRAVGAADYLKSQGYIVETRAFLHAIGKTRVEGARNLMNEISSPGGTLEYGSPNPANPAESPTIVTIDWPGQDFRWNNDESAFLRDVVSVLMGTDENGNVLTATNANILGTPNGNIRQIGIFQTPLDMLQKPGELRYGTSTNFINVPIQLDEPTALPFNFGVILGTGNLKDMFNESPVGHVADGIEASKFSGSKYGTYNYLGGRTYVDGNPLGTRDAIELSFNLVSDSGFISFDYFFASTEYDGEEINDVFSLWILGSGVQQSIYNNVALLPDGNIVNVLNTRPVPDNPAVWWQMGGTNGIKTYIPIGGRHTNLITEHKYRLPFAGRTTQLMAASFDPESETGESLITPGDNAKIRMAIANMDDGLFPSAVFIRGNSVTTEEIEEVHIDEYFITIHAASGGGAFGFAGEEVPVPICPDDDDLILQDISALVAHETMIHFFAVPDRWHVFSHWEINSPLNQIDLTSPEISFIIPGNDIVVTAHFTPKENRYNVLLLDVSGSMDNRRINEMKREVGRLLNELLSCEEIVHQINIAVFSEFSEPVWSTFRNFSGDYILAPGDINYIHPFLHYLDETLDEYINTKPGGRDILNALVTAYDMLNNQLHEIDDIPTWLVQTGRIHLFSTGRTTLPRYQHIPARSADANPGSNYLEPYTMHDYLFWREANLALCAAKTIHERYFINTYIMGSPTELAFERRFMKELVGGPPPIDDPALLVLNFSLGGGEFTTFFANPVTVEYGEEIILPTSHLFSREGYRFAGWFTDENDDSTRARSGHILQDDMTLHARWEKAPENFLIGDVLGRGYVSSAAGTAIARYLAGQDVDIPFLLAADLNGDGYVDMADLILLARWLVGL